MVNPHVLVVPYPAQGHVIPLLELSRCLVEHGVKVTFVNTEHVHMQMKEAITMEGDTGSKIHQVFITVGSEDGKYSSGKLTEAILRVLPRKLEELIEDINGSNGESITCVLVDQTLGWALEIAEKKAIKRAAFCPAAAALLVLGLSIPKLIDDGVIDNEGTPTKKQVIKLSPDMPAMNTQEFAWACLGHKAMQKNVFELMLRNNKSRKSAEWLLCNSSYDLEPAAFTMTPHILPIGPLLASNRLKLDFAGEDSCLTWLDQQATRSVVYVAFGSLAVFNPIQFKELALGLELSNRPFLWVARPDMIHAENEVYLKEFNDRVATQGLIVAWAPQQRVLSHRSIACFVSHCGWNSIMEGLGYGVPFLCWPYFADQFLNRTYISEIWKIGLGFERDESGFITSREIKNKVEQLLGNGEIKARALDIKKLVMDGIKEGGGSNKNFKDFVEWIKGLV
ncbi:putative hexosyltransferase [Rosa chinensis]|uniref:Putative hexosyltransferase n=1 Tax=Rosa chinensis TaxID=74649 RepID=A0A2P6S3Y5_ROSCH|nr:UDP-glycosyltransferase 83A1 [Rosa chinensis]PRQ53387.1 putative hexosyltransferase [Rosa chinensis]